MRFKWILILLTIMFFIVLFSKGHTQTEKVEYVKINTIMVYDTVHVDSLRNIITEIPIETIDTLQTNM